MSTLPERVAEVLAFDEAYNKDAAKERQDAFGEYATLSTLQVEAARFEHARTAKLTALMPSMTDALERMGCRQFVSIGAKCRSKQDDKCIRCELLARIEQALGEG